MDDELRDLYQEVILDHSKRPRNFGHPASSNRRARGDNPLCGDRMDLYLTLEDDVVTDVAFVGRGCAISMASASLMTEMIKGKPAEEVRALFDRFRGFFTDGSDAAGLDELDKLSVFAGVRQFPVRVKCATLAWHTMAAALEGEVEDVSTED